MDTYKIINYTFPLQLVITKLNKQDTNIFLEQIFCDQESQSFEWYKITNQIVEGNYTINMIYCVLKSIKILMVKFLISKNFQKHFLDSNLHIKYLIQADLKFSKIN